ncbi:MAG: DUF2855 family protein [Bacteroidota bacterium]
MATIQAFDFAVKKDALHKTKLIEKSYSNSLAPNQVLLEVDTFSLTSNNITYAVMGEQMHYWRFFPTEQSYGIIPAWGFADVVVSSHPDIKVGQRFYGYYPMGSHLLVAPNKVGPHGFMDSMGHRRELPVVYNFYANTAQDPTMSPQTEAFVALFRPLFVTSFLIDHHLAVQNFYNADQILITSASSKTAQALAFSLANRKKEQGSNFSLVGLTSNKNLEFVRQLGWYDETLPYNGLNQLKPKEKFVVVDFTGNHNTQYALQTTLGENLVYNCLVGLADWQHLKGEQPLPTKGELFFAPSHAEKWQKVWGISGFQQQVGWAWQRFIVPIQSAISITEHEGVQELEKLYLTMLKGNIDPTQGNMVHLR